MYIAPKASKSEKKFECEGSHTNDTLPQKDYFYQETTQAMYIQNYANQL